MREEEFKQTYIATYLATQAALRMDDACARGEADKLSESQPVEDAETLANDAWDQWLKLVRSRHEVEQA